MKKLTPAQQKAMDLFRTAGLAAGTPVYVGEKAKAARIGCGVTLTTARGLERRGLVKLRTLWLGGVGRVTSVTLVEGAA